MGSPEYGVETSGDQEIAQVLAPMEGVGPLRAVPFDELIPGTYHTLALDDATAAASLTARYEAEGRNMEMFTLSAVPEDAPRLLSVLRSFDEMFDTLGRDLPNAWGALYIQDWQTDLKRIEIYIEWDTPVLENGEVVRDAQGNILVQLDENGNPIRASSGKTIYVHARSNYFNGGD